MPTLSGGEQQMCAIGRGIMSSPKLLMIDECRSASPPDGGAPRRRARGDHRKGITILLVEQDVMTAFEIARPASSSRPEVWRCRHDGGARRRAGDPGRRTRDVVLIPGAPPAREPGMTLKTPQQRPEPAHPIPQCRCAAAPTNRSQREWR